MSSTSLMLGLVDPSVKQKRELFLSQFGLKPSDNHEENKSTDEPPIQSKKQRQVVPPGRLAFLDQFKAEQGSIPSEGAGFSAT